MARGWFLSPAGRIGKARDLMREYDIRAPGPETLAARLSGGNQQKIVVARELDRKPAVLIAHQAAWGLDPGATRFVLDRMLALREAGAAIVYFSSELEEVLEVSDRIAVMANGEFRGLSPRATAPISRQIGLWMAGRSRVSGGIPYPGRAARPAIGASFRLHVARRTRRRASASRLSCPLLCAAVLIALSGHDPLEAFAAIVEGAVGIAAPDRRPLNRATPYLIAGRGVALCFRAGIINIGAEGQIAVGGAGAAAAALAVAGAPPALAIVAALCLAELRAGALWAGLAPAIHLGRGVHEVLVTLLLNFVALLAGAAVAGGTARAVWRRVSCSRR